MSILPQYHKIPTCEDVPPVWSAPSQSYDPTPSSTSLGPAHTVAYTFSPRFPVKGEKKDVIALIGVDKAVSAYR